MAEMLKAKRRKAKMRKAKGEDAIRIEEGGVDIDKTSRAESKYIVKQQFPTTLVYMYTSPSFSILLDERQSTTN